MRKGTDTRAFRIFKTIVLHDKYKIKHVSLLVFRDLFICVGDSFWKCVETKQSRKLYKELSGLLGVCGSVCGGTRNRPIHSRNKRTSLPALPLFFPSRTPAVAGTCTAVGPRLRSH